MPLISNLCVSPCTQHENLPPPPREPFRLSSLTWICPPHQYLPRDKFREGGQEAFKARVKRTYHMMFTACKDNGVTHPTALPWGLTHAIAVPFFNLLTLCCTGFFLKVRTPRGEGGEGGGLAGPPGGGWGTHPPPPWCCPSRQFPQEITPQIIHPRGKLF